VQAFDNRDASDNVKDAAGFDCKSWKDWSMKVPKK
jgi:hypothetical protein